MIAGTVVHITRDGSALVADDWQRDRRKATHFAHRHALQRGGIEVPDVGMRLEFNEAEAHREGLLPLCHDIRELTAAREEADRVFGYDDD